MTKLYNSVLLRAFYITLRLKSTGGRYVRQQKFNAQRLQLPSLMHQISTSLYVLDSENIVHL
jgi:hypothetical protein